LKFCTGVLKNWVLWVGLLGVFIFDVWSPVGVWYWVVECII